MEVPNDRFYTKTHEWVKIENGLARIGITDFAQQQLSDLTYVELPAVDDEVTVEEEVGVVESVKAASDVYAPISGDVVEVNEELDDKPESINTDPYGEGWLFVIRPSDRDQLDELLDVDEYKELIPD